MKRKLVVGMAYLVWSLSAPLSLLAAGPVSIRVAGWNLQGRGETDESVLQRQLAEKQGIDIWGLSEVLPERMDAYVEGAADGEGAQFESILGTTGEDIHLAIVYDTSAVELIDSEELFDIQPTIKQRAPLVARFRGKQTGREFLFMVNHLARTDPAARKKQAKLLNAWGKEQNVPVIAVGDYNLDFDIEDGDDGDRDPAFDFLTDDNVFQWVRPLVLVRTEDSRNNILDFVFVVNSHQMIGWQGVSRILNQDGDSIATDDDFSDTAETSDHRPVDAVFSFGGTSTAVAAAAPGAGAEAMADSAAASAATSPATTVPARTDDNLIVAAYNIQFFGKSPHDNQKLAKVIQAFDVCGIVEVHEEAEIPKLVAELERQTGKKWGYAFGVRTHRPGGEYHEAYGVVWRRDRVEAGDGVVGGIWDLEEAYRNDPYVAAFKRKNFDFVIALIHTRWSDDPEGTRENEVLTIPEHVHWMKTFITERDLILAGDFNFAGSHHVMQQMMQEANLEQLDDDPKSTFKTDGSGFASAYDHILVGKNRTSEYIDGSCNTLHVAKVVYGNDDPQTMRRARRELSDHLPVFAVFDVTQPDDD